MPSLSPHPAAAAFPPSPRASGGGSGGGGGGGNGTTRPPLSKRHSSQSSHAFRNTPMSPGSASETYGLLRQPVKPAQRHAKVLLPRNLSSGRNLAKMGRQAATAAAAAEGRKHSRQKSHEGDTEIRLPGSLDESRPAPMRRNMTMQAFQLPRNVSHTKLKKNLSHGQLSRIGSGRNLQGMNSTAAKPPPSPGLKGKTKRPRSAELEVEFKNLHEQEVELAQKLKEEREGHRKVGFAVGSAGDTSEADDDPQMEGSGLQEDEWTDQSASASPHSTRQNTANNSRRTSMGQDRGAEWTTSWSNIARAKAPHPLHHTHAAAQELVVNVDGSPAESHESEEEEEGDEEDEGVSPTQLPLVGKGSTLQNTQPTSPPEPATSERTLSSTDPASSQRSPPPPPSTKGHANPTTKRILSRSNGTAAPALVSNVSALDNTRSSSARTSPESSLRSSRATTLDNNNSTSVGTGSGDQEDELVSRFIPSASHPSTGSGSNTTMNTPKTTSGFHTPEQQPEFSRHHLPRGPISPGGSTLSTSSTTGALTPSSAATISRSRTEVKLANEKAMVELEESGARHPVLPAHVFDRNNTTLRSYLSARSSSSLTAGAAASSSSAYAAGGGGGGAVGEGLGLGPELFQGRFKAVNTELKVVQRFRDPLAEAVARLLVCPEVKFARTRQRRPQRTSPQKLQGLGSAQQQKQQQQSSGGVAITGTGGSGTASAAKSPRVPTNLPSPPQTSTVPTSTPMAANGPLPPTSSSPKAARRGKVTFSQPAVALDAADGGDEQGVHPAGRENNRQRSGGAAASTGEGKDGVPDVDAIARKMWEAVLG